MAQLPLELLKAVGNDPLTTQAYGNLLDTLNNAGNVDNFMKNREVVDSTRGISGMRDMAMGRATAGGLQRSKAVQAQVAGLGGIQVQAADQVRRKFAAEAENRKREAWKQYMQQVLFPTMSAHKTSASGAMGMRAMQQGIDIANNGMWGDMLGAVGSVVGNIPAGTDTDEE